MAERSRRKSRRSHARNNRTPHKSITPPESRTPSSSSSSSSEQEVEEEESTHYQRRRPFYRARTEKLRVRSSSLLRKEVQVSSEDEDLAAIRKRMQMKKGMIPYEETEKPKRHRTELKVIHTNVAFSSDDDASVESSSSSGSDCVVSQEKRNAYRKSCLSRSSSSVIEPSTTECKHDRSEQKSGRSYSRRREEQKQTDTQKGPGNKKINTSENKFQAKYKRGSTEGRNFMDEQRKVTVDQKRNRFGHSKLPVDSKRFPAEHKRVQLEPKRIPAEQKRISLEERRTLWEQLKSSDEDKKRRKYSLPFQKVAYEKKRVTHEQKKYDKYEKDEPTTTSNAARNSGVSESRATTTSQLHQYYRNEWRRFSFPGEDKHPEVRWRQRKATSLLK